ncbi:MAG TPA: hypothetical protein DCP69_10545 [Candidatus Omnitrophica bacterium]|nr:hypothetical protein [Candidatus Omnitrophota bacterium]
MTFCPRCNAHHVQDQHKPNPGAEMNCSTCPHFATMTSQCRMLAPALVMHAQPNQQVLPLGVWPHVRAEDWCGKHPGREGRVLPVAAPESASVAG